MCEWQELAERLVEVDVAIEDMNTWATQPADVEELGRLEHLRDELHAALTAHHVTRSLRRHLQNERGSSDVGAVSASDPRD